MPPYDPSTAVSGTIEVIGNRIIFTPNEPFDNNSEYTVVVTTGIETLDGKHLIEDYTFSFQSKLSPMYCDIDTVIDDISPWLTNVPRALIARYIYRSSVYEDQIAVDEPMPVNILTGERELTYEAEQFARYDAVLNLLNRIYLGKISGAGESIQLADLVIKKTGSSDAFSKALGEIKRKREMWHDAIMGHHMRKYAKPTSASKGKNLNNPIPSRSW
jgi:hypothetical protein